MAVELIIAPEAQQDVDEAYCWYEDRRLGLGEEFLGCVEACIQAICRMPELHVRIHEEYRRALVRRFPFGTIMLCKTDYTPEKLTDVRDDPN